MLGRANLGCTVSEMIAGFRQDRQEMEEKARAQMVEFMSDLSIRLALGRANLENTVSSK